MLTGVAAGAMIDPERLLWRKGATTISIPAVRVATNEEVRFLGMNMIPVSWVPRDAIYFCDPGFIDAFRRAEKYDPRGSVVMTNIGIPQHEGKRYIHA